MFNQKFNEMTIIFILSALFLSQYSCQKWNPKSIPDGVSVIKAGDVVTQGAIWKVLVTLDVPTINQTLLKQLHRTKTQIDDTYLDLGESNPLEQSWTEILNALKMDPRKYTKTQRPKRGLFNFIGSLSSTLFGTVSQAQLDKVKAQISSLANSSQQVLHQTDYLLTMVNHTAQHVNENRNHILALQTFTDTLATYLNGLSANFRQSKSAMVKIGLKQQIINAYIGIEFLYHKWLRQVDHYHQQRAALELGFLTEEVLAPDSLSWIIRQGGKLGFDSLPLEWYYSHIKIEPLWQDAERLVFQAMLPFVDGTKYLRYKINTWVMPGSIPNSTIKLISPTDVAENTRTGNMFFPEQCKGYNPAVCIPQGIFHNSRLHCPHGIISGHEEMREACYVQILKRSMPETGIHMVATNVYVLETPGEEIAIHCSGQPGESFQLAHGVYQLQIRPSCTVSSSDWHLVGLVTHESTFYEHVETLDILPFNLTNLTEHPMVLNHLAAHEWSHFSSPLNVPIKHLKQPFNLPVGWGSHVGHVSWSGLVLGLLLAAIVVLILCWKGRERIRQCCRLGEVRKAEESAVSADSKPLPLPFQWRLPSMRFQPIYPNIGPAVGTLTSAATEQSPATAPPSNAN